MPISISTRSASPPDCCTTSSKIPTLPLQEIEEYFGPEIAHLVDGLTKISKLDHASHEERQALNMRKMLLAMVDDVRVVLVKLADRLHNMRTLEYLPGEKRRRIAQETLDVYAPIAHRLGMSRVFEVNWKTSPSSTSSPKST